MGLSARGRRYGANLAGCEFGAAEFVPSRAQIPIIVIMCVYLCIYIYEYVCVCVHVCGLYICARIYTIPGKMERWSGKDASFTSNR